MLTEMNKRQFPSTSESFYTPSKDKNPSSVETNPSSNFVNSLSPINLVSPLTNLSSVQSYQYSGIQYSQSLNVSPSFMSPNREIGSFSMTPDQSSLQFQFRPQSQIKNQQSDLRLKTKSFIKVHMIDDISESDKSQKKNISQSQIRQVMRMVQKLRTQKVKKEKISLKLNHQVILNQHLIKMIKEKQEKLLYHKNQVLKRVQKRNELTRKLKEQKSKMKVNQQVQISRLRAKSSQMSEQFHLTQRQIQFDLKNIQILQKQKQSYQQLLRQRSISQQYQAKSYIHPFSFAPHHYHQQVQPQLYSFQNPQQINYSKQFSSTKRVSFKDTPQFSSQQNSARMKKSSSRHTNKNIDKSQLPILQVLRQHFTKKFHQSNQHENNEKKDSNNTQKNMIIKKALEQMIDSLSERQNSPRPSFRSGDKSETQSQIAIECESLENYSDYKIQQSQYYSGRKRRSVDHSPSQKDKINISQKKYGGAAKQFLQSIVNIMCDSSDYSDNVYRNHEFFSPRPDTEEENKKRKRSTTQQFISQMKVKNFENIKNIQSQVKFRESQKKSGDQTPVFRSQNSEQENDVRFSQMLLASLKNQNQQDEQLGHSQTSENGKVNQSLKNLLRRASQSRKNHAELIKIEEDMESSNKKTRKQGAFNTIRNNSEQTQQIQIIDQDDKFLSCSLNTESKVISKNKDSSPRSSIPENKYSKSLKIQDEDQKYLNELSKTDNSYVQKHQSSNKKKKKIQQKRSSLDLTKNQKSSYHFQTVPQEDEALQQDTRSLIIKKLSSKTYSKTTL